MDHMHDQNLTVLHQIRQQHELPDFVKSASRDSDAVAQLPDVSFADSTNRLFPCHTRPDTFLSYAYFTKHANDIDATQRSSIYDSLQRFATHWSILDECRALEMRHEKAASASLDDLTDDNFAIVESVAGDKYRAAPLLDNECVKMASAHLEEYRERYPVLWRRRAAQKIAAAAERFGEEVSSYIQKAAGHEQPVRADLAEHLFNRVMLINYAHHGEAEQTGLAKLARAVITSEHDLDLDKLASLISRFDTHYQLTRHYRRGLISPEEMVYGGGAEKSAASVREQLVPLTTGTSYTKTALAAAGLEPYGVLGEDFVNLIRDGLNGVDIEKAAELIPTLPRDDAVLLDQALRSVGAKSADRIKKSAGLPDDISTWTQAEWNSFNQLIGA